MAYQVVPCKTNTEFVANFDQAQGSETLSTSRSRIIRNSPPGLMVLVEILLRAPMIGANREFSTNSENALFRTHGKPKVNRGTVIELEEA